MRLRSPETRRPLRHPGPLGPLPPGGGPGPSPPNLDQQTPPQAPEAPAGRIHRRTVPGGRGGGCPNLFPGAGGDKGLPRRRTPLRCRLPLPLSSRPWGTPRRQVTGPRESPRIRGSQAAARWAEPRRGPRGSRAWPGGSKARSPLRVARSVAALPVRG